MSDGPRDHVLRDQVGPRMASALAAMGMSLVEPQTAGCWKSSSVPAHYTRTQRVGKGAMARYYAAQAAE